MGSTWYHKSYNYKNLPVDFERKFIRSHYIFLCNENFKKYAYKSLKSFIFTSLEINK